MHELFSAFGHGTLYLGNDTRHLSDEPWTPHPTFAGVWLKQVVQEETTGGRLSAVLVRIEPGCAIGCHTHEASMELHEVIAGEGYCRQATDKEGSGESGMQDKTGGAGTMTLPYRPGCMALIHAHTIHEVVAGAQGLCLFAKFIPSDS